ncbi:MAG TPA: Zn-binding domain-containing protein [Candidatus Eisenbacteria bacterium]|nr:Zn-binding domain-containing protein [Candidatus Eisenbacteria bacterium]
MEGGRRRLFLEKGAQLELLGEAVGSVQSDFYSYRYFGSEGFLPGYSFPRLPLSAYIPGRRSRSRKGDEFVSRPRFLAISEFGPRAIVYHEGVRYRINRVILPIEHAGETDGVVTRAAKQCDHCGYLQPMVGDDSGPDLCQRCERELGQALRPLFRMENVSTRRTERINSDEEERLRLGFEIRSGVRFSEHGGRPSQRRATVLGSDGPIAEMTYGDTATLWRINLGWKRRARKEELGFLLDTERGYWAKNQQDEDDPDDPLSASVRRVIPYVEDWRNCLLLEMTRPLDVGEMASLESALRSAIQVVYQLEEVELASEPLPSNADRRLLLFYESAEGGAGVLRRLVDDAEAVPQLARRALEICHFDPATGADLRRHPRASEECEAACYDCLMSYMNQPDHPRLDRQLIAPLLRELAGARVETAPGPRTRAEHLDALKQLCDSGLEREWLDFLEQQQLRLPDEAQHYEEACRTRADFVYRNSHTVVYVDGPHHDYPHRKERDAAQVACLEDRGWTVVRFGPRAGWEGTVAQYPSVFGRSVARVARDARPAFEVTLFPPDWRSLLASVVTDGIRVEPGRDVTTGGAIVGQSVAELRGPRGAIDLVDARDPLATAVASALGEAGRATLVINPTLPDAGQRIAEALGAVR